MKTGIELIAEERWRQQFKKGYTPEHDADHDGELLALAACCYAYPPSMCYPGGDIRAEEGPFEPERYKPSENDRIRELVKAGALIAAEIDRLQNLAI